MATECPLMVAFTAKGQARLIYCGRWACPHCSKVNARQWAHDAYYGIRNPAQRVGKCHFWTFTMPSRYTKPSQAYKVLPRLWDTLRKNIQRDQKRFTFIAFVEGQPKRGHMPHFHVLTFNTIPKGHSKRKDPLHHIKDFAVHMGFGYYAEDEIVSGRKAASYVSKYASKGCPEIPKGFRRVRCSRNWQKAPKPTTDPYLVRAHNEPIEAYLMRVSETSGVSLQNVADAYENSTVRLNQERLQAT